MDLTDIMEAELSEHVEKRYSKIKFIERTCQTYFRYVNNNSHEESLVEIRPENPKIQYVSPSGKIVTFGHAAKPNAPTKFELNIMRDRLNSHRRWIQLGILIGTIGLGSRVPAAIEWYDTQNKIPTPVVQEFVAPLPLETPSARANKISAKEYASNTVIPHQKTINELIPETKYVHSLSESQISVPNTTPVINQEEEYVPKHTENKRKESVQNAQEYAIPIARVAPCPVIEKHNSPQPMYSWIGGTNPLRQLPTLNATADQPVLEKRVELTYRPPKRFCVQTPREKVCYSRNSKSVYERREYRRLEKAYLRKIKK